MRRLRSLHVKWSCFDVFIKTFNSTLKEHKRNTCTFLEIGILTYFVLFGHVVTPKRWRHDVVIMSQWDIGPYFTSVGYCMKKIFKGKLKRQLSYWTILEDSYIMIHDSFEICYDSVNMMHTIWLIKSQYKVILSVSVTNCK